MFKIGFLYFSERPAPSAVGCHNTYSSSFLGTSFWVAQAEGLCSISCSGSCPLAPCRASRIWECKEMLSDLLREVGIAPHPPLPLHFCIHEVFGQFLSSPIWLLLSDRATHLVSLHKLVPAQLFSSFLPAGDGYLITAFPQLFLSSVFSDKFWYDGLGKEGECQGSCPIFCTENWGYIRLIGILVMSAGSGGGENCSRAGLWLTEGARRCRQTPENMFKNQWVIALCPRAYSRWLCAWATSP